MSKAFPEGQESSPGQEGALKMFLVVFSLLGAFLVAQTVKNLPAVQETWVQSLSQEDPLEEGMATHSSVFAWRIPWTEEPGGGCSPWGCRESDTTEPPTLPLSLLEKTKP